MRYLTIAAIFIAAFAVVSVSPKDTNNEAVSRSSVEAAKDSVTEVGERAENTRDELDDTLQTVVEEDANDKEPKETAGFNPGRNPS